MRSHSTRPPGARLPLPIAREHGGAARGGRARAHAPRGQAILAGACVRTVVVVFVCARQSPRCSCDRVRAPPPPVGVSHALISAPAARVYMYMYLTPDLNPPATPRPVGRCAVDAPPPLQTHLHPYPRTSRLRAVRSLASRRVLYTRITHTHGCAYCIYTYIGPNQPYVIKDVG